MSAVASAAALFRRPAAVFSSAAPPPDASLLVNKMVRPPPLFRRTRLEHTHTHVVSPSRIAASRRLSLRQTQIEIPATRTTMARPLSSCAEAATTIAALLLLLLAAATPARAQNATDAAAPLAIGGDRLVFNGRRASVTWRAAAAGADAGASLLASATPDGGENATALSATLALRFGRLAEIDAAGEVVRRVPSLARLAASEVTNGE
jgi:hypothetical protein